MTAALSQDSPSSTTYTICRHLLSTHPQSLALPTLLPYTWNLSQMKRIVSQLLWLGPISRIMSLTFAITRAWYPNKSSRLWVTWLCGLDKMGVACGKGWLGRSLFCSFLVCASSIQLTVRKWVAWFTFRIVRCHWYCSASTCCSLSNWTFSNLL